MIVGAACLSHTPMMDRARADRDVEKRFFAETRRLGTEIAGLGAETVVVFYPDHYNFFFYNLMPAFCIGIEARSIGDYGTVGGELPVASALAQELVVSCLADGIDVAFTHRMDVDHGVAQPLDLLFAHAELPTVIPVFINCAAAPRPGFARACALGAAVGRWAASRPETIYLLASGGLSHDPPLPRFSEASPEVRKSLIEGGPASFAARLARQTQIFDVGEAYASGKGGIRPINEAWDRSLLEALRANRLDMLDAVNDDELTEMAGTGAHEARTWFAALAALGAAGRYSLDIRFYEPIKEWITGTGIVTGCIERP